MRKLPLLIALSIVIFASWTQAQTANITSRYTVLKKDCRAESKVPEGTEPTFICKGFGGYRVRINAAGAWAETIEIIDRSGEQIVSLGTHGYGYSAKGDRRVEWRIRGKKPYAVIFRVNKYESERPLEDGDSPYLDKYKTGEALLVRGLPPYTSLETEIEARNTNANAAARAKADAILK